MHQDQRIGLALGVLLVGACAAFFFRNEARTAAPVPRLQHAQELDDRIAERPTRPYLKGIEAVEAADRRRAGTQKEQESPDCDHNTNEWNPLDTLGIQSIGENSSRNRKPRAAVLDDVNAVQELAPIAIPGDYRVSEEVPAAIHTESIGRHSNSKTNASDAKVHVVQKGETLSSIAAKTLGSSNRFHEIFEANQDQLRDPNDLKLGMTLRIPDARHGSTSKSEPVESHPVIDQNSVVVEQPKDRDSMNEPASASFELRLPETRREILDSPSSLIPPALPSEVLIDSQGDSSPTDDSSTIPTKKFLPSRRTPPPARPIGPQAKNSLPRETSGRRLTQASLESTSGKVAR